MNTPAHVLLNLAVLSTSRLARDTAAEGHANPENSARAGIWITAGAVLPDAPMFLFFLWQRAVLGEPHSVIWSEAYFRDSWQLFFDLFNSIPLALLGLALSLWASRRRSMFRGWALLCASVLLHCVVDLLLHHDDAHAHFLPFSAWHFESPVSYWDPRHNGRIGGGAELIVVFLCSARLWRASHAFWPRALLASVCVLSVAGYAAVHFLA